MTRPAHASNSQISSWLRCGKAYQLERLLGAKQSPAVYLVTGNAVHAAIERASIEYAQTTGRIVEVIK